MADEDIFGLGGEDVERLRRALEDVESVRFRQAETLRRPVTATRIEQYLARTTDVITAAGNVTTTLTTLDGAINDSVTAVVVHSVSSMPTGQEFVVTIGSEQLLVLAMGGSGGLTLTVVRGWNDTTAASHADATNVNLVQYQLGSGPVTIYRAEEDSSGNYYLFNGSEGLDETAYNKDANEIATNEYVQLIREPFSGLLFTIGSGSCGCDSPGVACYSTPGVLGFSTTLTITGNKLLLTGADSNNKTGSAVFGPGKASPIITTLKFSKSTGSGLQAAGFYTAFRGDATMSTYLIAGVTYTDSGTVGQVLLSDNYGTAIATSTTFTLSFSVDELVSLVVTDSGTSVTIDVIKGGSTLKTLTQSTSTYATNPGFQGIAIQAWPSSAFYVSYEEVDLNGAISWQDGFTDTSGTLISSHSPNVGCGRVAAITSTDTSVSIDTSTPGKIDLSVSGGGSTAQLLTKAINNTYSGTSPTVIDELDTITLPAGTFGGTMTLRCTNDVPVDGMVIDFDGGTCTASTFHANTVITSGTATENVTASSALATDLTWSSMTAATVTINFVITVSGAGTFKPRVAEVTAGFGGGVHVLASSFLQIY